MATVILHSAIDGAGRDAIGLTREDALGAVGDTPRVAVTSFVCWDLSAAMLRGGTLPVQFALEQHGTCIPRRALLEHGRW
jgi:hypothetical protein